jgi:hypothetical protein
MIYATSILGPVVYVIPVLVQPYKWCKICLFYSLTYSQFVFKYKRLHCIESEKTATVRLPHNEPYTSALFCLTTHITFTRDRCSNLLQVMVRRLWSSVLQLTFHGAMVTLQLLSTVMASSITSAAVVKKTSASHNDIGTSHQATEEYYQCKAWSKKGKC